MLLKYACHSDSLTYRSTLSASFTEDKASEIAKMGSIYRGAALTIAAASAACSTDGFLQDRTFEKTYGNLFRIPYCHKHYGNMTRGFIFLSGLPISDRYQEPLDERGWTMQEDMLPLCLLRFGSKQTTWTCPTFPGGCQHRWRKLPRQGE
jgi:hypothetical protein